ncbi:MAG: hypothetical protein ACD_7C00196G0002 [uncultured bacterium]|nr:MAG: hypothetical protein ACD_7C00196G0002 [uncultured bacterium]
MPESSNSGDFVRSGTVSPSSLNARDWLEIIECSLESCKNILRKVFEKRGDLLKMEDILNHQIEDCYGEYRITPKEVKDTLPKSLINNSSWIFVPVKTLETREEKGQFFERRLFILVDLAKLVIVDATFRKDPQPDQRIIPGKAPKINENVSGCQIYMDYNDPALTSGGFTEEIMPYFADAEMKLGETIIMRTLNHAVTELREIRDEAEEIEKAMKQFLEMRKRLGGVNNI